MKQRILVITPIYYPNFGGAEMAIFEICKGLTKDFKVDLICPNFGGKKVETNKDVKGFTIYRTANQTKSRVIKAFKYQYAIYKKAIELSKTNKYNLIHMHYTFPLGIAAIMIKKKLGIPLVVTEHHFGTGMDIISDSENPKILNPIMKKILMSSDKVVSTGITQNNFLKRISNNKLEFQTIELGGEDRRSKISKDKLKKKLNIPRDSKVIFNVGRLVKRKRNDILIKAAKKTKKQKQNFIYLIAGKGPELENLRNIVKKENLEDTVKFLGFVNDGEVSNYWSIADCFVSCSEFEGAGITYFEAFASEVPLFAKKNEASVDIVKDKTNGFLFSNEQDLSRLLIQNLSNETILKKVIDQGKKTHNFRFNWKSCGEKYNSLFKKILKIS